MDAKYTNDFHQLITIPISIANHPQNVVVSIIKINESGGYFMPNQLNPPEVDGNFLRHSRRSSKETFSLISASFKDTLRFCASLKKVFNYIEAEAKINEHDSRVACQVNFICYSIN